MPLGKRDLEPSYGILKTLLDAGYRVIQVNPKETAILGVPAVASLADIESPSISSTWFAGSADETITIGPKVL